ncbi:MAG: hypothetical protein QOE54_3968 [Streptosporangiaceae bacterium]|jgi:hypothetical protein|nr:hypothetical protein [Streptosporangiaceae bacterium]MDX6431602.1 hypothetical protein [Streptosporangiaceae bacterium]
MFNRPPLEERIAAHQRERAPLKSGKYVEHRPAALVFAFVLTFVVLTHIVALVTLALGPR